MTPPPIRRLACLIALLGCGFASGFAAAPAQAANTDFNILAGADRTGQIDLLAIGPYLSRVDVFEIVGGRRVLLKSLTLGNPFLLQGKLFGNVTLYGLAHWRCDRRERTFIATATTVAETFTSDTTGVKTPSCSKRFRLAIPTKAKPKARITATVSDSFGLGDARPKLCVIAPKPPRSTTNPHPKKPKTVCRVQPIRPGVLTTRKKIQVKTKGTWIFELRGQGQRSRQTVAVGVKRKRPKTGLPVLLLGDSLMSQLITPIADRLEGKADVDALVRGGGRLTETEFDWYGQARTRLERLKPRVAVMLIGGGDGFPIKSGGQTIECCSEAWVTAYEPYVLKMMKVLSRNGRTAVAWGLQPAAESGAQREVQAAVNRAAELVYRQVPVTGLIDLNTVVSPGFQYQEYKTVGGRSYKIRASDGIHFTVFGAAIAGNFIADSIAPLLRH